MKVFKIISKSLKLILRSKTSLATTLLAPLLIIVIIGFAFGSASQYSLNIGVYADEKTELINSFIEKLENQSYKIIYYPLTELCVNDIKKGSVHTCIEFPRDFELGKEGANEIQFFVDESKPNIVAIVNDVVIRQLKLRTSELASEQTADVLGKIGDIDVILEDQLIEISEVLVTSQDALSRLDSIDTNVEYLTSSVDDSTDSVKEITSKLFGLQQDLNSINDLSTGVIDRAIDDLEDVDDLAANGISLDVFDYYNDKQEDLDEDYNGTTESIDGIKDLVETFNTKTGDVGSYSNSINDNLKSAQDQMDDMISSMILMQVQLAQATGNIEGIDLENTANLVAPIKTNINTVASEKSPLLYMFPTLLVMVIMLVSTMLAGTLVVMEKTSSAFFRNFVTPTADMTFIMGTFITNIIIVFSQVFLILLVSHFVFDTNIIGNSATIITCVLIIASLFTLIGMMLGYLVSTPELVTMGGIGISSLFIMMSGVLFPLEQVPESMMKFISLNPVLMGESILRKAIVFDTPLLNEVIMRDVFLLLGLTIGCFILVVIIQKIKKEIFLSGANILKKKKVENLDELEEEAKKKSKSKSLDYLDEYSGEDENAVASVGIIKKIVQHFKKPNLDANEKVYSADGLTEEGEDVKSEDTEIESDTEDEQPKATKKSASKPAKKAEPKSKAKPKKAESNKKSEPKEAEPKKEKSSNGLFGLGKKEKVEAGSLLYEPLEPHQYFVLSSGDIVKSFSQLVDFLGEMDLETFSYHVAEDKNDFFLWIKNVLKSDIVASKIKNINDPVKMGKILRKYT